MITQHTLARCLVSVPEKHTEYDFIGQCHSSQYENKIIQMANMKMSALEIDR